MRKTTFIANVFKMSFAMLGANLSNICYSIYISAKAGAESIGVFHLVMSVYSLAMVVSISGIGLTVTRLVSDSCGKNAGGITARCLAVCTVTSCTAAAVMYVFSDDIASKILSRPECAICIRMLAPALICMAVSAVTGGYFTAMGKVGAIAFGRFVSEAAVWSTTFLLMKKYTGSNTYIAVVAALSLSAAAECICNLLLWRRGLTREISSKGKVTYKTVINLCAPIAAGSYLRTGLSSAENIMIPQKLALHGVNDAMAQYGIIKGMSIPIMMFPSVFTNAFSNLIVPEIARRRSEGKKNSIRYISTLSVEYVLKFAFMVSGVLYIYHTEICRTFYIEKNSGVYLGLMSLLPLLMFADTVIDSVLKGLDKQVSSLKINIADSLGRVIFIAVFVPKYGILAYIVMLYISEFFNILCSYFLLRKTCSLKFPFKSAVIHPTAASAAAGVIISQITFNNYISGIMIFCIIYILILCLLKSKFS